MDKQAFVLWINNDDKIISFHREINYISKEFDSRDEYESFILIYGRSGYKFK